MSWTRGTARPDKRSYDRGIFKIAPLYGKTQQAVSRHFVDAKDIIEELRDELKKLYYDD